MSRSLGMEGERKLAKFIENMNKNSEVVYLEKLTPDTQTVPTLPFIIKFRFTDPYIKSEVYNKGHVIICLSDKFYSDVNRIAEEIFGRRPFWNHNKTSGWFLLEEN